LAVRSKRAGGGQIDDQFKLARLHYRQAKEMFRGSRRDVLR